jgi:HPt (histidine-containing phosphotransfer) domain-containing protein
MVKKQPLSKKVFNKNIFFKRYDGKSEMANTTLMSFLRNVPLMIEEIKDACSEKDYECLSIYGHTLMGASENVSAESMKDIGFDIQIAGKAKRINEVKPLIEKLEIEFEKLKNISSDIV